MTAHARHIRMISQLHGYSVTAAIDLLPYKECTVHVQNPLSEVILSIV